MVWRNCSRRRQVVLAALIEERGLLRRKVLADNAVAPFLTEWAGKVRCTLSEPSAGVQLKLRDSLKYGVLLLRGEVHALPQGANGVRCHTLRVIHSAALRRLADRTACWSGVSIAFSASFSGEASQEKA